MSTHLKGKLTLTVHRGRDLADKQIVGKQDPYLVMVIGDEELKTKVHHNGGTAPEWEQSFIFNLNHQEHHDIHMKLWDKELLLDRVIGRADIPVIEMLKNKGPTWYSFVDKDNFKKIAGYVSITCHFEGTGAPTPKTPDASLPSINYNENRSPSPAPPQQHPQQQQSPQQQFQQIPQGYPQQGYPQQGYPQGQGYQQPPPQYIPQQQQQPLYYVPAVAPAQAQVYVPPPAQVPHSAPKPQHAPAPTRATGQSEWACKACTYWNKPSQKMKCEMCDTPYS